jgi:hypothetical protein
MSYIFLKKAKCITIEFLVVSHFPRDRESLVVGLLLLVSNHPWRSAKKTADRYRAFPSSFEEGTKGWWQTLTPASEKEEGG